MRRAVLASEFVIIVCLAVLGAVPASATPQVLPRGNDDGYGKSLSAGRSGDNPGGAVSLITGERVLVGADGNTTIDPTTRRSQVSYQTRTGDGHTHVVPDDVEPLLASGRLDEHLFDVTALLEPEYQWRGLALIVTTTGSALNQRPAVLAPDLASATSQLADQLTRAGAVVNSQLPAMGAVAIRRPDTATRFWENITHETARGPELTGAIGSIILDAVTQVPPRGTRRLFGPASQGNMAAAPRTAADQAATYQVATGQADSGQSGANPTGDGITVAVLDGGIDDSHPDLAGKVDDRRDFTDERVIRFDSAPGTFAASVIAGTGAASQGKLVGVAPGARLLDGRICGVVRDSWMEEELGCLVSWTLAGMQWAAADKHAPIVFLASRYPVAGDTGQELVDAAVDTLTASYGTLFVVPVSDAPGAGKLAPAGLAVAAIGISSDVTDGTVSTSHNGALKPDLAAREDVKGAYLGSGGQIGYTGWSGPWPAAAQVAGAAAVLSQARPGASASDLKAILMASATAQPAVSSYRQGAGELNLPRALASTGRVEPPSVGFGMHLWSKTPQPRQSRTITYRNPGSAAAVLDLTTTALGPDGKPAPAGMFTVTPSRLSLPPAGSATVTLSTDPDVTVTAGSFTGQIVATGGSTPLTTPFAVTREVERYGLTLNYLDAEGKPTDQFRTRVQQFAGGSQYDGSGCDQVPGPVTKSTSSSFRLPKGQYIIDVDLCGPRSTITQRPSRILLIEPNLSVMDSVSLTVDARRARPYQVQLPGARAEADSETVAFALFDATGLRGTAAYSSYDGQPLVVGQITDTVYGNIASRYLRQSLELTPEQPPADWEPASYQFAWQDRGRLVTGLTRVVSRDELATVRSRFDRAENGIPTELWKRVFPVWTEGELESNLWYIGGVGWTQAERLPAWRTEYLYGNDAVRWMANAVEISDGIRITYLQGQSRRYPPGSVTTERWNHSVFGPSQPSDDFGRPAPVATREKNRIRVRVGMFTDGEGHYAYRGYGSSQNSQTTLYRNDVKVGSREYAGMGFFDVASGDATYRLAVSDQRTIPVGLPGAGDLLRQLSPRVSADWKFRSASTSGQTPLPLWTIRFTPEVDDTNTAPAGRPLTIGLTVAPQSGAAMGTLKTLTVDVSYDDGVTWAPIQVRPGEGTSASAVVTTPAISGYASLRAHLEDSRGNTHDQTIIHAYRIG